MNRRPTRSVCTLCLNYCGILAYSDSKNRVTKIEGDPENPRTRGHVCAKGLSSFLDALSPNRIKRPMRRTNPTKGIGVDPKWEPISWGEAIDAVAAKVRETMKEKPRLVAVNTFDQPAHWGGVLSCLISGLGWSRLGGGGFLCGTAIHPINYMTTSSFEHVADSEHVKYVLLIGAQMGSMVHYDTMKAAMSFAAKRPRDIKVVAVDPMAGYAASRAEEWVPIRPGTDAALVLSLVNLLINEYKVYDEAFLKRKTNAPYLLTEDGLYLRDKAGKPLIWEPGQSKAVPFDDSSISDYAIEGTYAVGGNSRACPSFQKLKDHLRSYAPEAASEITTVPAETIRRLAREIGEAARIGETITIGGKELPYRPVSVVWYRGISAHKNSFLTSCACMLLAEILGAIQVPGGIRAYPPFDESATEEGLMTSRPKTTSSIGFSKIPYPPEKPSKPRSLDASDLFPISYSTHGMFAYAASNPSRFGFGPGEYPYPKLLFIVRSDNVTNTTSPAQIAEIFSKIDMVVQFAVEPDGSTDLADIVFPDLHHLERLSETVTNFAYDPGVWYAAKPAASPPFERPYDGLVNSAEVFLEIVEKAGFLPQTYASINKTWRLEATKHALNVNEKYGYLDLIDRQLKHTFDDDHGVDWLLSPEGGLEVRKPTVQELYPGPFREGRVHIYWEFLLKAGREVDDLAEGLGIKWDTSDYQAVPDWKPCPAYGERNGDYDLFVTNYKLPILGNGPKRNPLLRKLASLRRADGVLINPGTAERKSIRDGDEVWVETKDGYKSKTIAFLSERIHPEVLATMQHRIKRAPEFNEMLVVDDKRVGFVNGSVDTCTLARLTKA